MWKLHRTPFQEILDNIFEALDSTRGKFAFPTVAGVARMKPGLVRRIVEEGHEVASHGFNHVRYTNLNDRDREMDLRLSLQTFRKMRAPVSGFRAPYDRYTDDMPSLIDRQGLVWDGGFGYREEYRGLTRFFHVHTLHGDSETTFIPLNAMSDDLMIDGRGWGPQQVTSALNAEVAKAAKAKGVVMFDLHPIRMGQEDFAPCLRDVAEYAQKLGGWIPTPSEAVTYWNRHGRWKSDHEFCLLLTGDIDNWVFSDYLRRVIWRRG